jgi:hypothetical protein
VGLEIIDLGQRVKTIFGQHHFMSALLEKNLRTTPNGVAVINDKDFESRCDGIHKAVLLNLNQFKIVLARPTLGTRPIHGHIGP